MNKIFLKLSVFIATTTIMLSACSKDDSKPTNPFNGKTTAIFNPSVTYGTMTDQDGNVYATVTIGTQTWMAENLRTTKYNDGTVIPNVTDEHNWFDLKTGAYCNYNNTINADTIATYGRLYNWYAINTGKLAPKGWHVPTDAEWTTLTDYLGGDSAASRKLREKGTTHWKCQNTGATNETGFTALPGGYRNYSYYGQFYEVGEDCRLWSATNFTTSSAWYRFVDCNNSDVGRYGFEKTSGLSVRCVRD